MNHAKKQSPRLSHLSEHDEQKVVVMVLRMAGVLFCAIPNAAKRSPQSAARLKAEGMESGAPDILIFTPPPKMPHFRGAALEMKRAVGGRVSPAQLEWGTNLTSAGWMYYVANGAERALLWLHELGYKVPR